MCVSAKGPSTPQAPGEGEPGPEAAGGRACPQGAEALTLRGSPLPEGPSSPLLGSFQSPPSPRAASPASHAGAVSAPPSIERSTWAVSGAGREGRESREHGAGREEGPRGAGGAGGSGRGRHDLGAAGSGPHLRVGADCVHLSPRLSGSLLDPSVPQLPSRPSRVRGLRARPKTGMSGFSFVPSATPTVGLSPLYV